MPLHFLLTMQILIHVQLLLSSSMDKTVRLWDMETKDCLKMFSHNDYGERHTLTILKFMALT